MFQVPMSSPQRMRMLGCLAMVYSFSRLICALKLSALAG
jgi:hypothetical protein